jgi:broad-specificity NMP kinase
LNTIKKNIILLNGTCGSGKSTIAALLSKIPNFQCINGDEVISYLNHHIGKKPEYNDDSIYYEYKKLIHKNLNKSTTFVLNSIFCISDYYRLLPYINIFDKNPLHIILHPNLSIAIERTKNRTCFNTITPEYWVEYFYNQIETLVENKEINYHVIDNSYLSIEETNQEVIRIIENKKNVLGITSY